MRAFLLTLLTTCGLLMAGEAGGGPPVRLPTMTTLDGRTLDAAALGGKVVVIEFWATWCAPCAGEVPHVKKLYEQYKGKGVVFIGAAEEKDTTVVKQYVEKHGISWPVTLDAESALARQLEVKALPRAFVLDREGKMVWEGVPHEMDKALRDAARDGE